MVTDLQIAPEGSLVPRVPGVREVLRQFPNPASVGRGSLGVEGGITIVGGPGMGKSTLLRQLTRALEEELHLAAGCFALPAIQGYGTTDGFYRYLGELAGAAHEALRTSPGFARAERASLRAHLQNEPHWDAGSRSMTPRGLERWAGELGQEALTAGGVCLLIDDADDAAEAPWKAAFVAALRFTFQASTGVTTIYATWRLFLDESLPGSNYFRNVTRPLFLEPLSTTGTPSERERLAQQVAPVLPPEAGALLGAAVGGHPGLLRAALEDACTRWTGSETGDLGAVVAADADRQIARVGALVAQTPQLVETLTRLDRAEQPYAHRSLPKAVVATGLVECDPEGMARLPPRVASYLHQA